MKFNTVKCEIMDPYTVVQKVVDIINYDAEVNSRKYDISIKKVSSERKSYQIECISNYDDFDIGFEVIITQVYSNGKSIVVICTNCKNYNIYTDEQKSAVTLLIKTIIVPAINEYVYQYTKFLSAIGSSKYRIAKRKSSNA